MTFGKIGARKMMYEWKNPYVTDGLVAMWDGEWNAGGGVHDAAATTWKDISGNDHDATFVGSWAWGDNYWRVNTDSNTNGYAQISPGWAFGRSHTQEFVIQIHSYSYLGRIIGENRGLRVREGLRGIYGWAVDIPFTGNAAFPTSSFVATLTVTPRETNYAVLAYYENGIVFQDPVTRNGGSSGITTPIFLGSGGTVAPDRWIRASYYCVRLYNRALTAAEIAANYAVDKRRFNIA